MKPHPMEDPLDPTTALLLIDIQNDYFPGGRAELDRADAAATQARAALDHFRQHRLPVIHVRHISVQPGATFFLPNTPGSETHPLVAPRPDERVILKHYPNSFRETDLQKQLGALGIKHLVVTGMMTLMCVDTTVRAAADLGYSVTVLHDACAARALELNGVSVPAPQVHAAFLAALGMAYAKLEGTSDFLARAGR
ncbi:cysteine hydrolase family protein [Myxococcus sp. XM-1-1-1]|uniref:cysteine hydrolase family protein n=1 Tax=Myxococcus sp. XM-1-1-1 TaxID=2874602 RepID=UPI001CC1AD9A|nr:cysteine hydrolase family protein [Myxococcus sp. XM-1-1-1]